VKAHVCQHIILGVIYQPGDFRETFAELIGHHPPLVPCCGFRFLGEAGVAIRAETMRH
jgi:hypothetical protein